METLSGYELINYPNEKVISKHFVVDVNLSLFYEAWKLIGQNISRELAVDILFSSFNKVIGSWVIEENFMNQECNSLAALIVYVDYRRGGSLSDCIFGCNMTRWRKELSNYGLMFLIIKSAMISNVGMYSEFRFYISRVENEMGIEYHFKKGAFCDRYSQWYSGKMIAKDNLDISKHFSYLGVSLFDENELNSNVYAVSTRSANRDGRLFDATRVALKNWCLKRAFDAYSDDYYLPNGVPSWFFYFGRVDTDSTAWNTVRGKLTSICLNHKSVALSLECNSATGFGNVRNVDLLTRSFPLCIKGSVMTGMYMEDGDRFFPMDFLTSVNEMMFATYGVNEKLLDVRFSLFSPEEQVCLRHTFGSVFRPEQIPSFTQKSLYQIAHMVPFELLINESKLDYVVDWVVLHDFTCYMAEEGTNIVGSFRLSLLYGTKESFEYSRYGGRLLSSKCMLFEGKFFPQYGRSICTSGPELLVYACLALCENLVKTRSFINLSYLLRSSISGVKTWRIGDRLCPRDMLCQVGVSFKDGLKKPELRDTWYPGSIANKKGKRYLEFIARTKNEDDKNELIFNDNFRSTKDLQIQYSCDAGLSGCDIMDDRFLNYGNQPIQAEIRLDLTPIDESIKQTRLFMGRFERLLNVDRIGIVGKEIYTKRILREGFGRVSIYYSDTGILINGHKIEDAVVRDWGPGNETSGPSEILDNTVD